MKGGVLSQMNAVVMMMIHNVTTTTSTQQLHNHRTTPSHHRYRIEVHFSATSSSLSVVASLVYHYVLFNFRNIYTKSSNVFFSLPYFSVPRHTTPYSPARPPAFIYKQQLNTTTTIIILFPISSELPSLYPQQRGSSSCLTAISTHLHQQIFQETIHSSCSTLSSSTTKHTHHRQFVSFTPHSTSPHTFNGYHHLPTANNRYY